MICVIIISYGELYPAYVDVGKVSLILLTAQLGKTTLTRLPTPAPPCKLSVGYISVSPEEREQYFQILSLSY